MKNLTLTFRRLIPFALAAGLAALAALPLDASVGIALRGRALARVVVAPDAAETERFAAGELSLFLHIVTGAEFPVREESAPEGSNLLVGPGATRRAGHDTGAQGLLPEEIVVRTSGRDLVLAGGSPRATLYAVYTFLEDVVGCRWWTSTASRMPRRPSLSVGSLAIRFKPPFEYREPYLVRRFRRCLGGAEQGQRDKGRRRRAPGRHARSTRASSTRFTRSSRRESTSTRIPSGSARSTDAGQRRTPSSA